VRTVADMLRAIHVCEDRHAVQDNVQAVIEKLNPMRLKEMAVKLEGAIAEPLMSRNPEGPGCFWCK